ncbi:hypothetical protein MA16_Dca000475 [Dendrobium catenatum]|uniref:Uncharacterized protein n=1 Tax=Dendrobium catenatum TaxID=906689 RepID=A0A2I0WTZ9_9ASPA|nr:hypothetical protein MA16_Dca000475 [Dendrobium catenatum]
MAMRPMSVVRSFSSARIRASTGKAVMDRATLMKTRKAGPRTPSAMLLRRTKDVPMPRRKGREMPATMMERARFPMRRRELRPISRPTRKRKKRRPMLASVSSTVKLCLGNMAGVQERFVAAQRRRA